MSCQSYTLIHEPVWHWAAETPDAPAVVGFGETLSYKSLAGRASALARLLQERGFSRGARAGLLMEGSVACCVGMLGALRAGGCYLPLGINHPPSRLAAVIHDAEPEAVMTVREHLPLLTQALDLAGVCPKALVVLDGPPPEGSGLPCPAFSPADFEHLPEPRPCPSIGEDLCFILYTSGSTGKPKGVMLRHSNVRSYLGWMVRRFGVSPADRLSGHASPTFDISVQDIFGAFWGGASVHPLETQAQKAFPGPFIASRGITVWNSVPSVISMMIRARQLTAGAFPSLRMATFAGAPMLPGMAKAWLTALPHCELYNNYGPTETTIICTWNRVTRVDDDAKPIPIGRPTADNECMVLSPGSMRPVASGQPGRIFVRGSQVSAGYWRRPDLTARAYLPDPIQPDLNGVIYDTGDLGWLDEEGVLHYLARADDQVKIQGFRVELGDVEAALSGIEGVIESSVLAIPAGDELELVACVSGPAATSPDGEEAILSGLSGVLPPYMVPRRVVFLQELPKNPNGKIDRKVLAVRLSAGQGSAG